MRGRFAVTVGLVALVVAGGCATAAAIASSAHREAPSRTVTGHLEFVFRSAVVRTFNAAGRLVAYRDVPAGHGHFRLVLKPGRYKLTVKFQYDSGFSYGCPTSRTMGVRANRTTDAGGWSQVCSSYSGRTAYGLAVPAGDVGPRARTAASCQRRFRDVSEPVYDRLVRVFERRHLTCSRATAIANHVATLYERGLPIADYPPSPGPPVGLGRGDPFRMATGLGEFTCHMTDGGHEKLPVGGH